jgi:hypothetical protein
MTMKKSNGTRTSRNASAITKAKRKKVVPRRNGFLWDKLTGKAKERREQRELAQAALVTTGHAMAVTQALVPKARNPKTKTRRQLETMKLRSADAFDYLQDDPDEAERVDAMSIEEFADERGIAIVENPVILAFIGRKFSKLESKVNKFANKLRRIR